MTLLPIPRCIGCGKTPDELTEYHEIAKDLGMTPTEYCRRDEGTYNKANGHFTCTKCYIEIGMPTAGGGGWKAP